MKLIALTLMSVGVIGLLVIDQTGKHGWMALIFAALGIFGAIGYIWTQMPRR